MIAVTASIPIQPEKIEEAIAAAEAMVKEVAQEEGTLLYSLCMDKNDPNTIVFIERYTDKDALAFHSSTPHFAAFMEKIMTMGSGQPVIKIFKELAAL